MKKNNIYLDHNSTSPLSKKVKDFLKSGEVDFFNPSSLHPLGQASQSKIFATNQKLYDFFGLKEDDFFIIYHSGVTEAVNLFAHYFSTQANVVMKGFISDHPCVYQQRERFESKESRFELIGLDQDFKPTGKSDDERDVFLNWTLVNNLSGHYWGYDLFQQFNQSYFKPKQNVFLHLDAAQLVGKVEQDSDLVKFYHQADFISFSGHKFGALKGVGFSFIKNIWKKKLTPLMIGGDQNYKLRASTMNTLGIYSMNLALSDERVSPQVTKDVSELRGKIVDLIKQYSCFKLIFEGFEMNACNTISFCHERIPSDQILPMFYTQGLMVSPGSACTSGAAKPNFLLEQMGHKDLARNLIRISLGKENLDQQSRLLEALSQVLDKISHL